MILDRVLTAGRPRAGLPRYGCGISRIGIPRVWDHRPLEPFRRENVGLLLSAEAHGESAHLKTSTQADEELEEQYHSRAILESVAFPAGVCRSA